MLNIVFFLIKECRKTKQHQPALAFLGQRKESSLEMSFFFPSFWAVLMHCNEEEAAASSAFAVLQGGLLLGAVACFPLYMVLVFGLDTQFHL